MLRTRHAHSGDVNDIAVRLRDSDVREIQATGKKPLESLANGLKMSDTCLVAVDDKDIPHVIFGVIPAGNKPKTGFIWMMASSDITFYKRQLILETRKWVDTLLMPYDLLTNAVYAKNRLHIRWLKWAGFIVFQQIRLNNNLFYVFAKLNNKRI